MIDRAPYNKMVTAPEAMKIAKERSQDHKAKKGRRGEFKRILGDPTACGEGVKQ